MNIVWSAEALDDLQSLRAYIASESPRAARATALKIIAAIENQIQDNPHMGRPGRVHGTRELIVPQTPYIVPYRVRGGDLQILRVYHAARRWPERF
jgi:toxin ParE1/3/4